MKKKLIIALLIIFATGIVMTSCQSSRGPKCPAMYSKTHNSELQKPM